MKARLGTRTLLLWLALALPGTTTIAQTVAPDETLPIDPRVRVGTLDNGLRYYIRANQRPENRAELRLVVNAGSVLEDDDQRGLAHFVEHMAFNGTRNFPKHSLTDYLERIGMRFGPDLNAYTSFDETVYMLTVPTDSEPVLDTAFQILEDWASGLTFDPEEIERERGVVIEEWRARRGAQARLTDRQLPVLLHGTRHAERLPIGLPEILETAPREALVRFYRDWYRPDLMAVIAVGDFDVDRIENLIRERFQRIPPAGPDARERTRYASVEHEQTLVEITTDPEVTTTNIELYFKGPAQGLSTVGDYRRMIMARLFNRMLNSRLAEIAEQPNPPFLGAQSGYGSLVRSTDTYYLGATVQEDGVTRGLEALAVEAARVARHGFTPTELARESADLLRSYERAYAERDRTESAAHVSEYIRHFLTGEAIPGIEYEYELVQRLLPTIQVEEINRLAHEWITDDNRVILISAPESAAPVLPDANALLATLASVDDREIAAYVDNVPDRPLLAEAPTPRPVVEEIRHDAVDVLEWRLANGARVLVKSTDFQEDEVLFQAYSLGGLSLADDDELTAARTATDVVLASGIGDFSRIELERALAGKAVSVAPVISERDEGFSGSASPKDLETLFQLVYLYFTATRGDAEAFAALTERMRASLANRDATPSAAFSDTLQVTLAQNHPRRRPPGLYMLDEMDMDASLAFFRDRFADAGDFTFVLVGNLDLATLKPLVETYIGGLPTTGRQESWRDHGVRPPTGIVEKVVRKGIEPQSRTQLVFTGPFTRNIDDSYALQSLAEALELRLTEVLREQLGGTYGVGVGASVTLEPEPYYSFAVAFGTAPERLEELTQVLFEQIEEIRRNGPPAADVEKVREQQRRERESQLRQNSFWVGQIMAYDRNGYPLSGILERERRIESLSVEMLRDAARRWVDPSNYVRVSLLPADTP